MQLSLSAAEPFRLCRMCRRPVQRSLSPMHQFTPWSVRRRSSVHAAAAPLRSFDDSDLDDEISNELARYSNPELVWNVGKVTCLCLIVQCTVSALGPLRGFVVDIGCLASHTVGHI